MTRSAKSEMHSLGFDKTGNRENADLRHSHSDFFQSRPKLLAKSVEGRTRLPHIDNALAAGHWSGNVSEAALYRPIGEPLSSPFQNLPDTLLVTRP
jgi:hypothetical protein